MMKPTRKQTVVLVVSLVVATCVALLIVYGVKGSLGAPAPAEDAPSTTTVRLQAQFDELAVTGATNRGEKRVVTRHVAVHPTTHRAHLVDTTEDAALFTVTAWGSKQILTVGELYLSIAGELRPRSQISKTPPVTVIVTGRNVALAGPSAQCVGVDVRAGVQNSKPYIRMKAPCTANESRSFIAAPFTCVVVA
jgi:hypothetical protein